MSDIPKIDRPREKLSRKGPAALSDFELLEVMIGSGNAQADVGQIARRVQKLLQKDGPNLSLDALAAVTGIGAARAGNLLASFELARRYLVRDVTPLRSMADVVARLDDIRNKQQEFFVTMALDGGQRLIAMRTVTMGTLDTVLAHPREVFADPIVDRAASVIIAHNHPSGIAEPSAKDRNLTTQLAAAGQLLGIPLRDHLILTRTDVFSFRQHHLLI